MKNYDQLKLENQLCFPFYAISRLITRQYQPLLEELELSYPQYLVLLILWEKDKQTVNEIGKQLILNTNTITPLLKRMETMELLYRQKATDDERKVIIQLTNKGKKLRDKAINIPSQIIGLEESTEKQIAQTKKFQQQLLTLLKGMQQAENIE